MNGLYRTIAPVLDPRIRWFSGKRFSQSLPKPLEVELDDSYGTGLADIFDTGLLLCANRLVDGFITAGVDNIDVYEAKLVDRKRKETYDNYKAVQIIGRVKIADLSKSEAVDAGGAGHTVVQFKKLVIKEDIPKGLLIFRMYEDATTILVHERVKHVLDQIPLANVSVVPAGQRVIPALDDREE